MAETCITAEPDFVAYTLDIVDGAKGSEAADAIACSTGLPGEAVDQWVTEISASACVGVGRRRGYVAEQLASWHSVVRGMCSVEYSTLQAGHPGATREELRAEPGLRDLNAARCGIRAAMKKANRNAHASRRRGRPAISEYR
jgi:hypothetical protein